MWVRFGTLQVPCSKLKLLPLSAMYPGPQNRSHQVSLIHSVIVLKTVLGSQSQRNLVPHQRMEVRTWFHTQRVGGRRSEEEALDSHGLKSDWKLPLSAISLA